MKFINFISAFLLLVIVSSATIDHRWIVQYDEKSDYVKEFKEKFPEKWVKVLTEIMCTNLSVHFNRGEVNDFRDYLKSLNIEFFKNGFTAKFSEKEIEYMAGFDFLDIAG
jgi:hypothetical protein